MNFAELESFLQSKGVETLADIARYLQTSPQAVSNWKSRDQIPYHIANRINQEKISNKQQPQNSAQVAIVNDENNITISDILIKMAQQLKLILIIPFISIFLTYTYVQFIEEPLYKSSAKVLLPESGGSGLGGLSGLADQFGVTIPGSNSAVDLSSPTLFPDLLKSRRFAENILSKNFYIKKNKESLTLLEILNPYETENNDINRLVTHAAAKLNSILEIYKPSGSKFSIIEVTTNDPTFSRDLADVVLLELEALNRYFKTQSVTEKISFIESRILSVEGELEQSEQRLKAFNEQNRQISSPSLELEQERLTRDVEIQREIFLTLKQQLELAKIEEVQGSSLVQVLDKPQIPLSPFNKNLIQSVLLATLFGLGLGIFLAFMRSYFTRNDDMIERKKFRQTRNFLKKKGKEIIIDYRIYSIISTLLLICSPVYFGHKSINPVYFNMYSPKLLVFNLLYLSGLIICGLIAISFYRKSKN